MPDSLMKKVKLAAARRNTTFRALVVDALERSLDESSKHFSLEDASAGKAPESGHEIGAETINSAIDNQREHRFTP